jgi:hypothetical protein
MAAVHFRLAGIASNMQIGTKPTDEFFASVSQLHQPKTPAMMVQQFAPPGMQMTMQFGGQNFSTNMINATPITPPPPGFTLPPMNPTPGRNSIFFSYGCKRQRLLKILNGMELTLFIFILL